MAFAQDFLTRIIKVQWGRYDNTATFGDGKGNMAASHNGLDWADLGKQAFDDGTGISGGSGSIINGEWLIERKLFVMRGFRKTHPVESEQIRMGMSSGDGFSWTQCDSHFGEGENTPELIDKHKPSKSVGGYEFRITGNIFTNEVGDVFGDNIERSSDGGKSWEAVSIPSQYSYFGPLRVLKGDGEEDVPVVVCGTTDSIGDNPGGVLASSNGLDFTKVYGAKSLPTALMTGRVDAGL